MQLSNELETVGKDESHTMLQAGKPKRSEKNNPRAKIHDCKRKRITVCWAKESFLGSVSPNAQHTSLNYGIEQQEPH